MVPNFRWQANAVVTVGDGRGFLIDGDPDSVVVTAARCLPRLPVDYPWTTDKRIYRDLIGPLREKPSITVECLFVDPVSDLAVLGPPDREKLSDKYEGYRGLVMRRPTLPIAPLRQTAIRSRGAAGWLLSIDGAWVSCKVRQRNGTLSMETAEAFAAEMLGSPILNASGVAIGAISYTVHPHLCDRLPAWLARAARMR